jgi:type IV pilus assembly protein PilF
MNDVTTASRRAIWLALSCLVLAACVTETSGGLPPPAPTAERVQAQLDLARGYLEKANFSSAKNPLARALEIDPRSAEAHVLTGFLYQGEQENDLAEMHYKTALSIEPTNSQALNNYGTFLFAMGRYEEALVPLRQLVRDPSYRARSQAFENLGLALRRVDQNGEAKSAFKRALELNFNQARSSLELAELAYEDGELKEAVEYYQTFRQLARQNAKSLCLGMKLGAAVGNADQVASYGLALKRLFPDQADECRVKS